MQIFPVFVPHAGCPHACLFCDQQRTTGYTAAPAAERVRSWLDQVLPGTGNGEIAFYGGSFSALSPARQETYLELARGFILQGRAGGIRVSTRPDALQAHQVETLSAGGVNTVEIGCQSLDDAVLRASLRGHTAQTVEPAVNYCRAAQMKVGLQLMQGLPGAVAGEAETSLRRALAMQPDFIRLYPALVLEGTGLADLWRQGRYTPLELDQAVDIVGRQVLLCREAGIPVIRVGLQQNAELERGVLAGPYHPAFGQLVKSRLWRWALAAVVQDQSVVAVHPHDLSDVLGHGRKNLFWLQQQAPGSEIRADGSLSRGCFDSNGKIYSMQDMIPRGD